jgi:ribosomal protein S6--L-glutamate ligase
MLLAAAGRLGLSALIINPDELIIEHIPGSAGAAVQLRLQHGPEIPQGALMLPRLGSVSDEYSLTVLRSFEAAGFPVVNAAGALIHVRNKISALLELAADGFPVLPFMMLRFPQDLREAAKKLGGFPLMVKFIRGSQGLGVMKAADAATAQSIVNAFNALGFDVYLEKFCAPRTSKDARVLVLRGKMLAAMERVRSNGDYRANVHTGAKPKAYEPSENERSLALCAAKKFGLDLCAVDFLRTKDGSFILEVNASPGFAGITGASGRDIAEEVLRGLFGIKQAKASQA